MLNINNLHNEIAKREHRKQNIYNKIFEKCCNRIMTVNIKSNDCYCLFVVPSFVFGVPLYNVTQCIIYVMQNLIDKGFKVQYTHPNLLYINWSEKPKKIQPSFESSQFKLIDINDKPSIYHPTDLKTIQYKASNLFNDDY